MVCQFLHKYRVFILLTLGFGGAVVQGVCPQRYLISTQNIWIWSLQILKRSVVTELMRSSFTVTFESGVVMQIVGCCLGSVMAWIKANKVSLNLCKTETFWVTVSLPFSLSNLVSLCALLLSAFRNIAKCFQLRWIFGWFALQQIESLTVHSLAVAITIQWCPA